MLSQRFLTSYPQLTDHGCQNIREPGNNTGKASGMRVIITKRSLNATLIFRTALRKRVFQAGLITLLDFPKACVIIPAYEKDLKDPNQDQR